MNVTNMISLILFIMIIGATANDLRIVMLMEKEQPEIAGWFGDALRDVESKLRSLSIAEDLVILDRNNEEDSFNKLCATLNQGISLLLDVTWSEWESAKDLLNMWMVPTVRFQTGNSILILDGLLDLLKARNASDAVLIFQTEKDVDQVLHNLVGKSVLRIMVVSGFNLEQAKRINEMRPIPSFFVIIGETLFVQDSYKLAKSVDLVKLSERWILAFTDLNHNTFDTATLEPDTSLLSLAYGTGCSIQDLGESCDVEKSFNMQFTLVTKTVEFLFRILKEYTKDKAYEPIKVDCGENSTLNTRDFSDLFKFLDQSTKDTKSIFGWNNDKSMLYLKNMYNMQIGNNMKLEDVAKWSAEDSFKLLPGNELKPTRTFYRIGTTPAIPWTYPKLDSETGIPLLDAKGQPIYEGYCIDLIQKMSEVMDFDYEIVTPKVGGFGRRQPDGSWTGIIGDLVRGDTDIAVAATIMTADREEAIDFIAPYFEQTGISIVMRRPFRKTSLFKFMTVLKMEVWLSIVAALSLTAVLLSILDKYSPYSARNNKNAYPYPCRKFTLKESFWFALTSFTPQGGGEAPKALSGRTLVAAYWLFVVLMLATFTANLAAFLTVERMQTPVSSLDQLARQSRINYTVVESQMAHKYFINMKNAEDTLYRVWKEITLNSSSDQEMYQVWDYPIKEQYGHILLAINSSIPVESARSGFDKVNENINGDFAFIHDSSEIKYEVSRNCNFTEVGDVFGERPYAIAIQQGSRLQDDLSKVVLELQKMRFFEGLTNKYWNNSAKGICPDSDESEGITLESLGGVFIATLFGLAVAMITLVWEIIYYKRKERKIQTDVVDIIKKQNDDKKKSDLFRKKRTKDNMNRKTITLGSAFKPVQKSKPYVSYIDVEPKIAWNP